MIKRLWIILLAIQSANQTRKKVVELISASFFSHRFRPKIEHDVEQEPRSDRIASKFLRSRWSKRTSSLDTLRRELQPLTDKVEDLYKFQNQRYDELKSVIR